MDKDKIIEDLRRQVFRLKMENDELQQKIQLELDYRELEDRFFDLEKDVDPLDKKHSKLVEEVDDLEDRVDDLERNIENLQEEKSELTEEIIELQNQRDTLLEQGE
jgi:chromosome segregation ATPase